MSTIQKLLHPIAKSKILSAESYLNFIKNQVDSTKYQKFKYSILSLDFLHNKKKIIILLIFFLKRIKIFIYKYFNIKI